MAARLLEEQQLLIYIESPTSIEKMKVGFGVEGSEVLQLQGRPLVKLVTLRVLPFPHPTWGRGKGRGKVGVELVWEP